MKEQLVVVQPTPFCNMRCRYCYLPNRDSHAKMSNAVFQAILDSIEHSDLIGEHVRIVWHAGEPLAIGRGFFKQALDATQRLNERTPKNVTHSIQTNGLLLSEAWLDLFQPHQMKVGLSLDGPARLHDLNRRTRQGGATHERVMKAVRLLQSRAYPFSVIMVVTREALGDADAVFDFFANAGIPYVGLNVEELESFNGDSTLRGHDIDSGLHDFYLRLLERQEASSRAVRFREFEQFEPLLDDPVNCEQESLFRRSSLVVPFSVLNFDVDGNFSTFCPELLGSEAPQFNNFRMGNVLSDGLDSILENPIFQAVKVEIAVGVQKCKEHCHYWEFCGGGNASNKFFENGRLDSSETAYCRQHKQIVVDAVLDFVENRTALSISSERAPGSATMPGTPIAGATRYSDF
jgi:uncharacterized protein